MNPDIKCKRSISALRKSFGTGTLIRIDVKCERTSVRLFQEESN